MLLRVGVWRVPLFSLAFFYQATLIATGLESLGMRLLLSGSLVAVPLILGFLWLFGPVGACLAILVTGILLVRLGYLALRSEGRAPVWHHDVGKPLIASLAMVPVSLGLDRFHVGAAILGGGVTYLAVLTTVGGLKDLGLPDLWNRLLRISKYRIRREVTGIGGPPTTEEQAHPRLRPDPPDVATKNTYLFSVQGSREDGDLAPRPGNVGDSGERLGQGGPP